jgi:hypothetical protein
MLRASDVKGISGTPDPSSASFAALKKQLLDAKAHLMTLRPASAEQVDEIMMATQLHAFLIKGAADGPIRYQDAYRAVDGVEQALDQVGQLGPLTFVQMQAFGARLQLCTSIGKAVAC